MTRILRRFFSPRRRDGNPDVRKTTAQTLRTRLMVAPLEDRLAPAIFNVTALTDTGTGSAGSGDLRYCITQANLDAVVDTVLFDASLFSTPQTITLSTVLPTITQPVVLQGTSARNVLISGNSSVRIMATATTAAAGVTLND